MAGRFRAQVAAWVSQSDARLLTVAQEAMQDLSEKVQTPRAKGGDMPVDTSFLINSFQAQIGRVPRGESKQPDSYAVRDFDYGPIAITINRAKIGDRIVFGWTAEYAPYMEARYGFLRLNVQQWQTIVNAAARRVMRRVGG